MSHVQLVVLEYGPITETYHWPQYHLTLWNKAREQPRLGQLRRRRAGDGNGRVTFTDQAYPDDATALGETLADFLMVCQVRGLRLRTAQPADDGA